MPDQINTTNTTEPKGSNAGLAFIVGALVVGVGVLAYVVFDDDVGSGDKDINVTVESAEPAAESDASSGGEGDGAANEGATE